MTTPVYNVYIATRHSYTNLFSPTLWCSLKTYYEENSKTSKFWQWGDPWLADHRSIEEIIDVLKENPPNVFGCGIYVWNEIFMDELAGKVKELWPDCLIVYGGPQPNIKYSDNFFKIKPWVDIVLPSDAYGEIVFKEILDYYPTNDYSSVPYIYYTDQDRSKYLSTKTIEKRSFKWPGNIFKAQEKFILPTLKDKNFFALTETARGCPYKCIYCDWGGGTYTKISKKPYTTVLDELEWLASNGASIIDITDANFGIMEIDIEIAQFLADLNKKYGFPKSVIAENAKNHFDRVIKIQEIFVSAGLIDSYKLALQTLDDDVRHNINRIDISFEQQIKGINHLRKNFKDLPIKVETILGLPGSSYQTTLDEINLLITNNLPVTRANVWMLLPEAPAYSKEMREKFKIETINQVMASSQPWFLKPGSAEDPGVTYMADVPMIAESVVGTYSYSRDEWVKMFLLNSISGSGYASGINNYLIKYLVQEHDIVPVSIIDIILNKFILANKFKNIQLSNGFNKLTSTLTDWVNEKTNQSSIDYHPAFPVTFSALYFTSFIILSNLQEFYQEICEFLSKEFNDPKIKDLGVYLGNSIIELTYDPTVGREFSVRYNWKEYFDGGRLTFGEFTYIITDTTIFMDKGFKEFDWYKYKNDWIKFEKQFLYQGVGDIHNDKISKTIKLKHN